MQILTRSHFPLFGAVYGVTGITCGLWWSLGNKSKVLPALSGVMIAIAALNGYIEQWGNLRHIQFQNIALILVGGFLLPYSILCIQLVEQAGIAEGRAALVSAFLPVVYLLSVGLLVSLRELSTEDNPGLIIYVFLIFTCALHIPAFAFGKSQTAKMRGNPEPLDSRVSANLLRRAIVALGTPLLILLIFQSVIRGGWTLFSLDVVMTVAIVSLFLVALGCRSNLSGLHRLSARG